MAIRAPDGANKDKELRWKSPHSLQDLSLCFSSLDWKSFNRQFQIFVFSDESKKELRLPWVALSPNLSKTLWVTLMLLPLPSFLSFCITISPQCKFLWHFLLVQLDRRWLDRLAHTVQVWRKAVSSEQVKGYKSAYGSLLPSSTPGAFCHGVSCNDEALGPLNIIWSILIICQFVTDHFLLLLCCKDVFLSHPFEFYLPANNCPEQSE